MQSYPEMKEKEEPGKLTKTAQEINEVVADIMKQIRARATRAGDDEPDSPPAPAPTINNAEKTKL